MTKKIKEVPGLRRDLAKKKRIKTQKTRQHQWCQRLQKMLIMMTKS